MNDVGDKIAHLLDASGPEADGTTLDAIVRRHGARAARRSRRLAVISVVTGLALGSAGLGVGLSAVNRVGVLQRGGPERLTPVKGSAASSGAAASGSAASASPAVLCTIEGCGVPGASGALVPLFRRVAAGVDVRVFTSRLPRLSPLPAVASCAGTVALVVEVSDAGAIGQVIAPLAPFGALASRADAPTLDVRSATVLGTSENAPMAVIVVQSTPAVASVEASFASGTQVVMAPVQGTAVLAALSPNSAATPRSAERVVLTARAKSGALLATTTAVAEPVVAPAAGLCARPVAGPLGVGSGSRG